MAAKNHTFEQTARGSGRYLSPDFPGVEIQGSVHSNWVVLHNGRRIKSFERWPAALQFVVEGGHLR